MKIAKRLLILLLLLIAITLFFNYPKLNILSGYSAKSMASNVFVGDRDFSFTDAHDNNFSPINIVEDVINTKDKSTIASVYGFKERKAIFREGLGCVLVPEGVDIRPTNLKPNRVIIINDSLPFPYGTLPQKDTIFNNINYNALNNTVARYTEESTKTRALLVIYRDKIIAEAYADGFSKDSKLLGWSMTKSITGTLYGILAAKGQINIDAPAPIAIWKNDERSTITINNLLQMNSGLEWEEDYGTISDVTKMLFLEPNMPNVQAEKPLVGKPNGSWNYSSGTTNLLSGILRTQLSNYQSYLDFPYKELIDKIGMHSMLIETDYEGNFVGSSYGWATARDWAKFGLLYLNNGNWNGLEIFNKDWVDYATTPTNTSDGRYGAQIWLNKGGALPDVPRDMYSFNGYQGQRVYIIPSKEMVVVRLGLEELDYNALLNAILETVN